MIECVTLAALRLHGGRIFTGRQHCAAMETAEQEGFSWNDVESDGWMTSYGRFVSREEAMRLAVIAGQVTEESYAAAIADYAEEDPDHGLKVTALEYFTWCDAREVGHEAWKETTLCIV